MTPYRALQFAVAVVMILAIAMVITEAASWPGSDSGCVAQADCYCEAFRADGFAVQPVNTASNVGFLLVGFVVLWGAARGGLPAGPLTTAYGLVAVGLGVGSALFHGTVTSWGGWADLVSMYAFISLYIAINAAEWLEWTTTGALCGFGALSGGLALLQVPLDQGSGKYVFGGLVGLALVTELKVRDRDRRWLVAAMVVFGVSFVVWNLSRTGAAWCDPDSALQGHAVWHLGSAATVWLLYRYLKPTLAR